MENPICAQHLMQILYWTRKYIHFMFQKWNIINIWLWMLKPVFVDDLSLIPDLHS